MGYVHCACRDCFDITIGDENTLCNDCVEAGCTPHRGQCCRPDAYGVSEETPDPWPYAEDPRER